MLESRESSPGGSRIPPKLRYFFRILLPFHIAECQLPIPKKFVCKYGKELSEVVLLKGPSGKEWPVTLKKTDGEVSFQNGWQDFVEYYSFKVGYFLAFRYDGNSKFKVVVFDRSACEKEYPYYNENVEGFNIDKGGGTSEKGSDDDSVENLGVSPACEPHWISPKDVGGKQQQPTKRNGMPRLLPQRHSIRLSVQPKVTKLENLTYETKSHKYRNELILSESPYSESRCKKQNVGSDHISILSGDGTRSEEFIHGTMSNCSKGKKKIDEFSIHSESSSSESIMSKHEACPNGVSSNGVERDSPEPTKSGGNIQELLPSVCNKSVQFSGRDLTKSTENFDSRRFKQKSRIEELSAREENHRTEPKQHISSSKSDYSSTQAQGIGYFSSFFLSKRRHVTTEERARASQAASAFKSSNPFFKVLMSPSYVCKEFRLHIPSNFVQSYLSRRLENITLQVSSGKRWLVGCQFSDKKLRTSRDWAKFVWENNLQEGDVCVFELLKMEGTELKVHIFRVVEVVPLLKLPRKKLKNKQR